MKDEAVPLRLVYQRLEEAYVKQHGPIELELSAWLNQIHAVVDRLLREEAVYVQEKEVAISQPISIGHDDRYSECSPRCGRISSYIIFAAFFQFDVF